MDPVNIPAKFEVRSFTHSWDNRGYFKNLGSPWIRPRSLFSQMFKGLLFAWTLWICLPSMKFVLEVRSFTHFWDNRGYSKNLGSPWIRPCYLFSQVFKRLLFSWTLWIYVPSLKLVALPIPEIIGGTQKNWAVPVYAHVLFSPKFLIGFCSHGPSEYICQIWSS